MHLASVEIRNVRSLKLFRMEFTPGEYAGWHVVLGDNGSGKSSAIRSIALCLAGPQEAPALRQNWSDWLRKGEKKGHIRLDIDHDPAVDRQTGRGRPVEGSYVSARLNFLRGDAGTVTLLPQENANPDPLRYVWGEGEGWFAASYGPFRRFVGGSKEFDKLFWSNPRLAPHLSAFGEDVALTEAVAWLQQLHVKHLEKPHERNLVEDMKAFINKGELLPHGTQLVDVDSSGVYFKDGSGTTVQVEQLSDGYRSVLSMTFELVRQLVNTYGASKVVHDIREGVMRINLPGVVLIDEIDAHLHPTWQRRIGQWFLRLFPRIQFIVTTHSPLICQAATKGSVWRLPVPDDPTAFAGRVGGKELKRLLYGDVLEAYDTELFGLSGTRSDASRERLTRLAELNRKSRTKGLNAREKQELAGLRRDMPLAAGFDPATAGGD
jgi:hypothetical protein